MTWRQLLPTAVTLAAMLCGFFSMLLALEGSEHFILSAQLIMLAMILDGLDGNLARYLKGTTPFGAELDTYVDMTAFGLAPAILIYQVSLPSYFVWRVLMTAMVVLSGVIRLARFKVKDTLRGQGGYSGLPITASAGWVAIFVFLEETGVLNGFIKLKEGPVASVFLAGVLVMIFLQVSNVRYPKPTKVLGVFVLCIILVAMLFVRNLTLAPAAAIVILLLGALYVAFGPMFVRLRRKTESGTN